MQDCHQGCGAENKACQIEPATVLHWGAVTWFGSKTLLSAGSARRGLHEGRSGACWLPRRSARRYRGSWPPSARSRHAARLEARRLLQDLQDFAGAVHAVPPRLAGERDDARRLEPVDRALRGGEGYVESRGQLAHAPERILGEEIEGPLGQTRRRSSEPLPPAGEELVDALDAAERVLGLLRRSGEEVSEPLPPLASLRHAEQARVVLLARALEEGAQVEERRGQHALGDEQQRDEQPSDAPVAVEEGVDGFELRVHERGVNEWGERVVVQEVLPGAEALHEAVRRRRHEGGVGERASRRADPVLAAPETAGRCGVAPRPTHESLVQLPHEPQRQRQRAQSLHAVLERDDVVGDLTQVSRAARDGGTSLGREELAEGRLRPFDATREHRLAPDEGADEQVRIREPAALAGEPADRPVCRRERSGEPGAPFEAGRNGRRHVGPVAARTADPAAVRQVLRRGAQWGSLVCGGENSDRYY